MSNQRQKPNPYEIIVFRTRSLVTDARGKLGFMRPFDNVIYDIFAVKNFAKNLNNAYRNRDMVAIINQIGTKPLIALLNERGLYASMQELILVNCRIGELKRILNKQSKKSKRDKGIVREYNYLCDLYKQAIKKIRHQFGIKNSKDAYKRRFRSLSRLIDDGDDYESILLRDAFYGDYDDDDYDDDYDRYFDDDYDYESSSSLSDLAFMLDGGDPRRGRRKGSYRPRHGRRNFDDFEEDDYEEDYDPYVREMGIPGGRESNSVDRKIDILADAISNLQKTVGSMSSHTDDELDELARKVSSSATTFPDDDSYLTMLSGLSESQGKLNHMIEALVNNQMEMQNRQDDIVDFLGKVFNDESDDEDEEDDDLPPFHPVVADDVRDDDTERLTPKDLIDAINGVDTVTKETTTKVEQTVTEQVKK